MSPPRSVLVVRLSALGDVIHTIPAVLALRNALPDARLTWAIEPAYAELVEIVARPDAVVRTPMKRWRRSPLELLSGMPATVRQLREAARGGVAIDFQGLMKSALIARVSGASVRYSFDRESIRERAALLLSNRAVAVDRNAHVVEWNLALAAAAAPSITTVPAVDFLPFAVAGDEILRRLGGTVVFVPGAGQARKQWPVSRFRELAERIGKRVVAVFGPGEEALARSIAEGGVAELAPKTGLRELARVLHDAELVVGGDTGPLHLAAALGAPVVGLYGPTDPRRNGPFGQLPRVVSSFETTRSMDSITVDDVLRKVREVLGS